ncbi:ABC-2 type transport system permease protein [Mesobacillus persicus]|uniref:ABC-2 type transport system permease protein n=1 Tax=Mesobacillus persicus TaxID=930146 RepID=A0A1H8JWN4_9BACI|nr:ABC transporter permease [Mesobacillus persicus]SEN85109.1 ABC-2 type transport system permease protein [Mesobacillus persicus]
MRNSFKVAKWEMKRNMKNKSFIISLFLTPILFIVFATIPTLLEKFNNDEQDSVNVYIKDELNSWTEMEKVLASLEVDWNVQITTEQEAKLLEELTEQENAAYIPLTEAALEEGRIQVYLSEDVDDTFIYQLSVLEGPLRQLQFQKLGLSAEEIEVLTKGVVFEEASVSEETDEAGMDHPVGEVGMENQLERIVPGATAGIVLFSIVITGMMIFQSASQEKKEKVAEIVLSSLTPEELMNGKIIGYFGLGMVQVFVWMLFAIPIITWFFEFPLFSYLFVPELLLLLFISFAGYLLFAAIFVGVGATVEDMTATSNFQGMVMMLPFLPAILIGPVLSNPSGLIAQIGSYFPLTSPAILLFRLSVLEEWPWLEIIISLVILVLSIWLFMKLAGKIFKTGILMYGKNATPQEIWKWIRQ